MALTYKGASKLTCQFWHLHVSTFNNLWNDFDLLVWASSCEGHNVQERCKSSQELWCLFSTPDSDDGCATGSTEKAVSCNCFLEIR